jgi:hypothetical protein
MRPAGPRFGYLACEIRAIRLDTTESTTGLVLYTVLTCSFIMTCRAHALSMLLYAVRREHSGEIARAEVMYGSFDSWKR